MYVIFEDEKGRRVENVEAVVIRADKNVEILFPKEKKMFFPEEAVTNVAESSDSCLFKINMRLEKNQGDKLNQKGVER